MACAEENNLLEPRRKRLPRGRHALPPEEVARDQRERILAAFPEVVAEHGYHSTTISHIVERAGVARGAFYKQFDDKHACFAAAHEAAHERLYGALILPCYTRVGLAERIEASLAAGMQRLAEEPGTARLLAVEAPGADGEIAARHHAWLRRYGALLGRAALGVGKTTVPAPSVAPMIVGGLVSVVAERVLSDDVQSLPALAPDLAAYLLLFYRSPDAAAAPVASPPQSAQPPLVLGSSP